MIPNLFKNRLIDFNGMSTFQGLFYAYSIENLIPCSFYLPFSVVAVFLRVFSHNPVKADDL